MQLKSVGLLFIWLQQGDKMNNTVVEAVNLTKTYTIGKIPVNALQGVNLQVEKGDGVDLSTLNDNQLTEVRLKIGFVFQFFNLIPRFTALDNVDLSMSIAGLNRNERRKRAEQLLENVGLKDRINHEPSELSGGQQRVAVARALANNPNSC